MSYRYGIDGDRVDEDDEDELPALAAAPARSPAARCEHNQPIAPDGGRCARCATAGIRGRGRRLRRGDLRRLVEDARARGEAS